MEKKRKIFFREGGEVQGSTGDLLPQRGYCRKPSLSSEDRRTKAIFSVGRNMVYHNHLLLSELEATIPQN